MIELLSYSQVNNSLIHIAAAHPDLARLFQVDGADADIVAEYAARLCYRSTAGMGKAPDFIAKRIEEGHEDVIEHATFTFRLPAEIALPLPFINRHITVSPLWADVNGETATVRDEKHHYLALNYDWVVTGNARVWLHLFRRGLALEILPYLKALAPKVFAEFGGATILPPPANTLSFAMPAGGVEPQNVVLLSANLAGGLLPELRFKHGSATFLLEHLSRTLTHQLVRHRLGSFSQESQRYIELTKGGWQPIMPPDIESNPITRRKMVNFYRIAELAYAAMRKEGIKREDARFLLPGATESRLVMSMDYAGWDNFFWQRLHKSAQWEIRRMAEVIHGMLYQLDPEVFKPLTVYQKGGGHG